MRLVLLLFALVFLSTGLVLWWRSFRAVRIGGLMQFKPYWKIKPIWKQREMFATAREFRLYMISGLSMSLGSLLLVVATVMGQLEG